MNYQPSISVLGEGAWGTALALVLARNGFDVTLWCHDSEKIVHEKIKTTRDGNQALMSEYIFVAIPVQFLRTFLQKHSTNSNSLWIVGCKGIEQETFLFPTQIIEDNIHHARTAVISGPSFARELQAEQLTGLVITSKFQEDRKQIFALMNNTYLTLTFSSDIIGIQSCAAFKNSIALATGILEGLGYHHNTQALCITYGLQEMATFVTTMGGNSSSVYGLAGIGDTLLTCSSQSRNFKLGVFLGSGLNLNQALTHFTTPPESINTLHALVKYANTQKLYTPLITCLYDIITHKKSSDYLLKILTTYS